MKKLLCLCAAVFLLFSVVPVKAEEGILPENSCTFSMELAETALALCGGSANDVKERLRSKGFEILDQINYVKANDDFSHTCAYTFAARDITYHGAERRLTAVVIRGTSGAEWFSNFDFSPARNPETQYAENFLSAAQDVQKNLRKYLLPDDLLLITGHSRGAAAAGLLGMLLQNRREDTFVYTFASPNTVRGNAPDCPNVFNLLNPCDMVTLSPLNAWGYHRAGKDLWLPGDEAAAAQLRSSADAAALIVPDIASYYGNVFPLDASGDTAHGLTAFQLMLGAARSMTGISYPESGRYQAQMSRITADSPLAPLLAMVAAFRSDELSVQHSLNTYLNLMNLQKSF